MSMRKIIYLSIGICLLVSVKSVAQNTDLKTIISDYEIGHFQSVIETLNQNMSKYKTQERIQAYRLLVLSYLAEDRIMEAEETMKLLLTLEPYYMSSWNDTESFRILLEKTRSGKTRITTASQQVETVEEAPIPITLVTKDMIRAIGARTLKDILITYVPGMTSVESPNEVNVAMHGIYSSGQQKILIMLNGHRLNSRSSNGVNPDYSISLDKVKQIEVLRGPASSLYGNVALTAVVNIITKEGGDINGIDVSLGLGNFSQKRMNVLVGKRFMSLEFMLWGSLFASNGQKIAISPSVCLGPVGYNATAIIEGYKNGPSYDWGMTCNWDNFKFLFSQKQSKRISSFADVHTDIGAPYSYDQYKKMDGIGPGFSSAFTYSELAYEKKIGSLDMKASIYFDLNNNFQYMVAGDSVIGLGESTGSYQIASWKEYTLGGLVQINRKYNFLNMQGSALLGGQIEQMNMYSSSCIWGRNFTDMFALTPVDPITIGKEMNYSAFLQLKHYITKSLILNMGLRYDYKIRVSDKKVDALSPRISLIYVPQENWNVKMNYSQAFVDAPYIYRFNVSPSYKGSVLLEPEHLSSTQLTFVYEPLKSNVKYECNLFYNKATDFIFRNSAAKDDEPRYMNAGKLNMVGLENTFSYKNHRLSLLYNLTCQFVTKGENYSFRKSRVYNVPSIISNLVVSGTVFKAKDHLLLLMGDARVMNKQLSPIDKIRINGVEQSDMNYYVPANLIVNVGIDYTWKNIQTSLHCYNLFNKAYSQGGSTTIPYPQLKRSFMLNICYHY